MMLSKNQAAKDRLAKLIADAKAATAARAALSEIKEIKNEQPKSIESPNIELQHAPKSGPVFSDEQVRAIKLAEDGQSFCLIGKAGTGKTTTAKEVIRNLIEKHKIAPLQSSTKVLQYGRPGAAVVSFTNRAVKNIQKGMPDDLKPHTVTLHKLLEFMPTRIMVKDAKTGEMKETMRFLPARNAANPLPPELKVIVFEESSMISTDLFKLLMDALPHECQFIFLGDLQQLPPVYGRAILGFKLVELEVVELTHIYRQAAGSPIIDLAWDIASGKKIPGSEMEKISKASGGKVTLRPWKKRLQAEDALEIMNKLFRQFIDQGIYDPNEDMIMIPYNKAFGTIEFNLNLAQHLGRKRNATVFEIIAGFNKFYFAVGDKVLVDRQEAIIEQINYNDMYKGRPPIDPSTMLNRWGMYDSKDHAEAKELTHDDIDEYMLKMAARPDDEDEDAKQQGSHILICRLLDSDEIVEVRTTGEYSSCIFAYALTVHKCQGSEWRKCFVILHNSHAAMVSRELLYTAVTRAREELVILCEPDSLEKGVKNQRIKGNTIKEKAEVFKGLIEKGED